MSDKNMDIIAISLMSALLATLIGGTIAITGCIVGFFNNGIGTVMLFTGVGIQH